MTSALRWGPALAWMGLIFLLSSQSRPPSLAGEAPDWLLHGIAYGALAALLHRAWTGRLLGPPAPAGVLLAVFAATTLFGASDEFHQSFVPGRHAELRDLVADAAGATLALLVLRFAARPMPAAPSPPAPIQ